MGIISLQTKKQVLSMFKQGYRSRKISESLHLDRSTVKEWQYLYDGGDTRWVTNQPIPRVYRLPSNQRNLIVAAYINKALTMADLCRTFLIPKTVLKEWVRHYKKVGPFTSADTRAEKDQRTRRRDKSIEDLLQCLCSIRKKHSKKTSLMQLSEGKVPDLTPEEFAKL